MEDSVVDVFRYCFGCDPALIPDRVVLTPVFPLRRYSDMCSSVRYFKGRLFSVMIGIYKGKQVAVLRPDAGPSFSGDAVLLLRHTQVNELLFAGTCGGVGKVHIGDICICDSAYNGEGFSRYHLSGVLKSDIVKSSPVVLPDKGYVEDLVKFVRGSEDVCRGSVFTIGSLCAEDADLIDALEEVGTIGIDMELSSIYAAAAISGICAAGLLLLSDLPRYRPFWKGLAPEEKKAYNRGALGLVEISLDFMVR